MRDRVFSRRTTLHLRSRRRQPLPSHAVLTSCSFRTWGLNKICSLSRRKSIRRRDSSPRRVDCGVYLLQSRKQNSLRSQTSKSKSMQTGWARISSNSSKRVSKGRILLKMNSKDVSLSIEIELKSSNYCSIGKFMQLPMSRIRTIINLDEDSQMISKEALVLITKATELFVQDLGGLTAQIAKCQKRKTILVSDIHHAA